MPTDLTTARTALQLSTTGTNRREYTARLIRAGRIRRADGSPGPFLVSAEALQTAVIARHFDGKATFSDKTLAKIAEIRQVYELDLTSEHAHQLHEPE